MNHHDYDGDRMDAWAESQEGIVTRQEREAAQRQRAMEEAERDLYTLITTARTLLDNPGVYLLDEIDTDKLELIQSIAMAFPAKPVGRF